MPFRKQREGTFYDKEILKYLPMDGVPTRNIVIDSTTVPVDASSGRYVLEAGTVMCRATTSPAYQVATTGSPTGGSFIFRVVTDPPAGDTEVSGRVAYNASAADMQTALEALPNVGRGNVAVTGTGPFVVRFIGQLAGSVPNVTVDDSGLTGGTSPRATLSVGAGGPNQSLVRPAAGSGESASDIVGILTHTVEFFYPPEPGITDEPAAVYFTWVIFDITKLVNYSGNAAAVRTALPAAQFA